VINLKEKILLKAIFIVSLVGLLFSGYLSFVELSGQTASCPFSRQIVKIPTCVYGFAMYGIIFALALFALLKARTK